MPWNEVSPMDQKRFFVKDYTRGTFTFTELCARYQISRKTGYKWIERFGPRGSEGSFATSAREPERHAA